MPYCIIVHVARLVVNKSSDVLLLITAILAAAQLGLALVFMQAPFGDPAVVVTGKLHGNIVLHPRAVAFNNGSIGDHFPFSCLSAKR